MGPRELPFDTTLDEAEDEIVDTSAALKADPATQDLAEDFERQMKALDDVRGRERQTRRAAIENVAFTRVADAGTDGEVIATGRTVDHHVKGNHQHPIWTKIWGSHTPTEITRLPRAEEVKKARGIVATLVTLAVESFKEHAKNLGEWVEKLAAGLGRLGDSDADRGRYVGERREFFIGLNRARLHLAGVLAQRAAELERPKEWAGLFFRKETRHRPAATEPEQPAPGPAPAPAPTPASDPHRGQ